MGNGGSGLETRDWGIETGEWGIETGDRGLENRETRQRLFLQPGCFLTYFL